MGTRSSLVGAHLRKSRACHAHFAFERDAERRAGRSGSAEERFEVTLRNRPLPCGVSEMTENEAAIPLTTRSLRELVDRLLQIIDDFPRCQSGEGQMSSIERLVSGSPSRCMGERGG